MVMTKIILILHNLRSGHNVGAILRSADAFGVTKVFCTGHTPYPRIENDTRLPHLQQRNTSEIHKTALGAELTVAISHSTDIAPVISGLKEDGYKIMALEQAADSRSITDTSFGSEVALIVGNEPEGIDLGTLMLCDAITEITQVGSKESLNVAVAAGIALFQIRSFPQDS